MMLFVSAAHVYRGIGLTFRHGVHVAYYDYLVPYSSALLLYIPNGITAPLDRFYNEDDGL
jgi:hypothetical protein